MDWRKICSYIGRTLVGYRYWTTRGCLYRCRRCHKIGHLYKDCWLLASRSASVSQPEWVTINPDSDQRGKVVVWQEENSQMDSQEVCDTHKEKICPQSPVSPDLVRLWKKLPLLRVPSLTLHPSLYYHLFLFLALHFVMLFLLFVSPMLFSNWPHMHPFTPPTPTITEILGWLSLAKPSTESSKGHDYNLRSFPCLTPRDGSGIGITSLPPQSKSSKGRHSNMSKAIFQAGLDVELGWKQPIDKVLRALNCLPLVPHEVDPVQLSGIGCPC